MIYWENLPAIYKCFNKRKQNSKISNLKSARNLNLQSGDVLVYVANEYAQGKSNLKFACDQLISRGIIILPVFVGTNVAVNELSLLAESQKTGFCISLMPPKRVGLQI